MISTTLASNAFVVSVNLTWDYNQNYNIQEGSIVQIVMYRTGSGSTPGSGADNNFTEMGVYQEESTYDAFSTPLNHYIVYETTVQQGINNYFVIDSFSLLDNYNRVYIRIFDEPITPMDYVTYSYWGLTPVINRPAGQTPINIVYANFGGVTNYNQFGQPYFEVIPDVPTGNLIVLGIIFFILWRSNKYYYEHKILHKKCGMGNTKPIRSISSPKGNGRI